MIYLPATAPLWGGSALVSRVVRSFVSSGNASPWDRRPSSHQEPPVPSVSRCSRQGAWAQGLGGGGLAFPPTEIPSWIHFRWGGTWERSWSWWGDMCGIRGTTSP